MNTLDLFQLPDRVAVITGGSRGLGLAMAGALAEAGARTVLVSRSQEDCEAAATKISSKTGRESLGLAADIIQPDAVTQLVNTVMNRFERIDVWINSAGINIRHPIESFPLADFEKIVAVNLTGTWLCCRAVGPVMTRQRSGSVINMASILGAVGLAQRTAYCSSKAGILGLTRTLALEWAPYGVRCNALCPGPFLTEINRAIADDPEAVQAVVGQTAFQRWGELHEIGGAALFLASDASTYMTGSPLFVDGGWNAG